MLEVIGQKVLRQQFEEYFTFGIKKILRSSKKEDFFAIISELSQADLFNLICKKAPITQFLSQ